jgi:hypothetical protein
MACERNSEHAGAISESLSIAFARKVGFDATFSVPNSGEKLQNSAAETADMLDSAHLPRKVK